MRFTKRQLWIACGTLLFMLVAIYFACGDAKAENKPPAKGEFFAAISARYINDLGVAGGVGYQWKKSGVMLLGQISYDQFNSVSGTAPFRVGCVNYSVPYTTSSSGHRGLEVTVAIPLRKQK